MNLFCNTKKQISPCIVSKVKFALDIKSILPNNKKICSKNYWILAVKSIALELKIDNDKIINSAIEKYDELIKQMYMSRIYKKHFVIYNNGGVISATTPKDWARANQSLFERYDFSNSDNTPIVEVIEKELTRQGFRNVVNDEVVIFYQYNSL